MAEWVANDLRTLSLSNQKSLYVGSGAPGTAYEGQIWVDVSTDPPIVKSYDDTNSQWSEYRPVYYETQEDAWASPSQTPVVNGTIVVLYNSTQAGTRLYAYSNDAWVNLGGTLARVYPVKNKSSEGVDAKGATSVPMGQSNAVAYESEVTLASAAITTTEDNETLVVVAGGLMSTMNDGSNPKTTVWRLYINAVLVDSVTLEVGDVEEAYVLSASLDDQSIDTYTAYLKVYNDNSDSTAVYTTGLGLAIYSIKT